MAFRRNDGFCECCNINASDQLAPNGYNEICMTCGERIRKQMERELNELQARGNRTRRPIQRGRHAWLS